VQHNVMTNVLSSGWTLCHSDSYQGLTFPVGALQSCPGRFYMFACIPQASIMFDTLATGVRGDVFYDTGISTSNVHTVNGVSWYLNTNQSIGFSAEGSATNRQPCDNAVGADKLSWPVFNGSVEPGYRCGSDQNPGPLMFRRVYVAP
jgi:hypothetical protein